MNLRDNDRLVEVRTAYLLNRIYNLEDRNIFKLYITILQCYVESFDEENRGRFANLLQLSVRENILGATRKEVLAAFKTMYEKPTIIAKKLGLSYVNYHRTYKDLLDRNFINEDFIATLKPKLDDKSLTMCRLINSFIDGFQYLTGPLDYSHSDHPRVLEIEFYFIYDTLISIFNGSTRLETFLYKLCITLEIEWGDVSYLMRNINYIKRNAGYMTGVTNRIQFKNELFNVGYLKGYKKYEIGKTLFGIKGKYVYTDSYKNVTKDITNDDWSFQITFSNTVNWYESRKSNIIFFTRLFRRLANEQY